MSGGPPPPIVCILAGKNERLSFFINNKHNSSWLPVGASLEVAQLAAQLAKKEKNSATSTSV